MNAMTIHIEKKEVCIIAGDEYEVLRKFTVIHPGREMDDVGYIINYEGTPSLLLSSHGQWNFETRDLVDYYSVEPGSGAISIPNDRYQLMNMIDMLKRYIDETEKALQILVERDEKQ